MAVYRKPGEGAVFEGVGWWTVERMRRGGVVEGLNESVERVVLRGTD